MKIPGSSGTPEMQSSAQQPPDPEAPMAPHLQETGHPFWSKDELGQQPMPHAQAPKGVRGGEMRGLLGGGAALGPHPSSKQLRAAGQALSRQVSPEHCCPGWGLSSRLGSQSW